MLFLPSSTLFFNFKYYLLLIQEFTLCTMGPRLIKVNIKGVWVFLKTRDLDEVIEPNCDPSFCECSHSWVLANIMLELKVIIMILNMCR